MLEFRTDALRNFLNAGHDALPGSVQGAILESQTESSGQQPCLKTDGWQGALPAADISDQAKFAAQLLVSLFRKAAIPDALQSLGSGLGALSVNLTDTQSNHVIKPFLATLNELTNSNKL